MWKSEDENSLTLATPTHSPTLEEFENQVRKVLTTFRTLPKGDKIKALILWNSLSTELELDISKISDIAEVNVSELTCSITNQERNTEETINSHCSITSSNLLVDSVNGSEKDGHTTTENIIIQVDHLEQVKIEVSSHPISDLSIQHLTPLDIDISPEISTQTGNRTDCQVITGDVLEDTTKERWKCLVCDSIFETDEALQTHRKNHIKTKHFQCNQCSSSFSTKGNLNVHFRSHSGEKPYSCLKCSSRFTSSGNLRRHSLTHLGLKPYRCSTCHSCYTEKKSLIIHQRTHSKGEKPFACPICPKRFIRNSVLQSHLTVHTNERKFTCLKCTKSFKQKTHLRRHFSYVHSGMKNFICPECGAQFVVKNDLQRHIKSHEGAKAFVCEKCGKSLARQENLIVHMQIHLREECPE